MIIEIKDLPTDRNVKTVNFTIEFEDGKVQHISQNPGTPSPMPTPDFSNDHTVPAAPSVSSTDQSNESQPSVVERPIVQADRPHKEVPAEMQDLEF